ncbi:Smr/MutS family protein [Acetanaerobacterium elongatum]|uniref:Smr domain-containing protein n=1 Tax=Acetanaerobacterium elongatum TaxID=258515 RepID=A0A1G9XXE6_9FIRM|nr:Smr/MutS family protein [Acetanaerobacterium elongatum]SDN01181.1 Smr domain-containing protein [Acetanaerobacterium elongatum]
MNIPIINLEKGMPYAEDAVRIMNAALRLQRSAGSKAVKLIHGYGSSGTGGRIKAEVHRALEEKKRRGEIREYIKGEEFSLFYAPCRKMLDTLPQLQNDKDYLRCNQGITIVFF